ncbi:MAG: hypothetical protein ACFCVH_01185 [Alphaproteobacteria bacterium]
MPHRPAKKTPFRIAAIALAALAAGCVSGQPTTVSPAGGALTVDQLNAALPGNSVVATLASGGSYCAYHSTETRPGGSMMLTGIEYEGDSSAPYRGLYRVEPQPNATNPASDPGFVCYSFPDAGQFAECRMVRATGPQVAILTRSGQPYATGEIRAGDACGAAL